RRGHGRASLRCSVLGAAEPASIRTWRHAHRAQERSSHHLGAAEAAASRHGFDVVPRLLEAPACGFDANLQYELRRGDPDLAQEDAREVPGTHGHPPRQTLNPEI